MYDLTRRNALKGSLGAALAVALPPFLTSAPAGAAVTNRVRVTTGSSYGSSTTSLPIRFPTAAAGNLLLAVAGVDRNAGKFAVPPGWRLAYQVSGTSVSLCVIYRIATGTEDAVAMSWSTASPGASWLVAEYTGISSTDPLGPLRGPAYSNTARTKMTLNPDPAEAASISLALFAIDSMNTQSTGGEFRPTASGWDCIATSYDASQGECPGTALTEYGSPLVTGTDLPITTFTWLRSDQVIGTTLHLNTAVVRPSLVSRWVGAVTPSGATIAVKVTNTVSTRLAVAEDPALSTNLRYSDAAAPDAHGMAKVTIDGLAPGTRYHYGVEVDGVLDTAKTGSFRTSTSDASNVTVAFGSCCNSVNSDIFRDIRAADPDVFIHMGDLHYGNISTDDPAAFRARYDAALASAHQGALYANVPTVYTWSDHDFGKDSANGTSASRPAAQATYRQYVPSYALPSTTGAVHQTFCYGRVRFIVTDNRSHRSPQSDPDTALKTILGAEQKQWFKDVISSAPEPVIIWVNETPWIGSVSAGSDRWGGYNTERTELADFISASGRNVAMLSGDMHALAADDGTNSPGRIPVFHAACLHGASTHKGGPYTHGPYPSTIGVAAQQYGLMRIVDTGAEISLEFTGHERGGTARLSYTKSFVL